MDTMKPDMYVVRVVTWNLPKNKLQKEIVDHFRNTQHLALLPAALYMEWVKTQYAFVKWANQKHDRCKPVELIGKQGNHYSPEFRLYTDFITIEVAECRRVITEGETPVEGV